MTMPNPRKRGSPLGKVIAGICAAVIAMVLTWAIWIGIAFAFEPPSLVYLFGSLMTFGLTAAALYTWAVDGPIVKRID
jgi:uncharacterized RDD family membrane protein YckC